MIKIVYRFKYSMMMISDVVVDIMTSMVIIEVITIIVATIALSYFRHQTIPIHTLLAWFLLTCLFVCLIRTN